MIAMSPTIGYIGLGDMGGALARRLAGRHPLLVHDRDPARVRRTADQGAVAATGLRDLSDRCEVIFLCLQTSSQVYDLLFGEDGLWSTLEPGAMIVDQTSGDPNVTREIAARLATRDIELVDAPVSGGPKGAESGTIAIMVGAGQEQYERVLPLLNSISPNVYHAGGIGDGHTMKLVNNLLSCTQRLMTIEAMALAAKCGMDPRRVSEILLAGGARNAYLERTMAPEIVNGQIRAGFTLGLAHKDVGLACALGDSSGVPMFFGNLARELYQSAINVMGREAKIDTAVAVMERLAGTHIMPPAGNSDGTGSPG
jgi:3-hydroxyisobutyrate dehydrogenase